MRNSIGREGLENPFMGAFANVKESIYKPVKTDLTSRPERNLTLDEVLDSLNLKDGMTLSFHHHLRNGDYVLDMVMRRIQARG